MVSTDGAVIGLIYYLFAPFGLVASRTFQPDPMMTAAIVTTWMCFYYWYSRKSWKWTILSGLSAGLALYIKLTSVFFLLPAMAVMVLFRKDVIKIIQNIQIWVIGGLSGLPVLAYHIYGLYITGELESQLRGRFFPQMWDDPNFYVQWKNAISNVTGHYLILIIGLLGLLLIKNKRNLVYLIFIWVGYILYGYTLPYHISTHYYYTLPIIPLLAVTIGAVSDRLIGAGRKLNLGPVILAATGLLLLAGVGGGYFLLVRKDYRHEPPYYKKVAEYMDKDAKIVGLSQDYGYRLSYFGWRIVQPWKGSEDLRYIQLRDSEVDSFSERFTEYSSGYDYFVVTRMQELRRQKDLYDELYGHYTILVEGGGYVIFDLSERIE
jgi:hypothetical protein